MLPIQSLWNKLRRKTILLALFAAICSSGLAYSTYSALQAAANCPTYTIHAGDTLNKIAYRYHTTSGYLAQLNHIRNINIIFVGQTICVGAPFIGSAPAPQPSQGACLVGIVVISGETLTKLAQQYHTSVAYLAQINNLRNINTIYVGEWLCMARSSGYAAVYGDLQWATQQQVRQTLLAAADRNGLPRNLVLAIAWEESNWTQHVISWDGGIGAMQLMPYTANWLNNAMRTNYNPYYLYDNIQLGTSYLRFLWNTFHGNLTYIISAYNEGAYNVQTRGIFNWFYVNRVESFIRLFS